MFAIALQEHSGRRVPKPFCLLQTKHAHKTIFLISTRPADIPGGNGLPIAGGDRGDAVWKVGPERDEQSFLRLEWETKRLANRIVKKLVKREGTAAICAVAGLCGVAVEEDHGRDLTRF